MTIQEAKEKIKARLEPILNKALDEGLHACLEIKCIGKDIFLEEEDEKKIKFISAQVRIYKDLPSDIFDLSFGIAAECYKGSANEEKIEEDLVFAEDRAKEFFEELADAEDKTAFINEKIDEEAKLQTEAAEQIQKTVRTSWISSIVALAVGGAILLCAAVVMIFVV